MRKKIMTLLIVLLLTGSLTACQFNAQEQLDNLETSILAQMQQYHLEYIGDNSGVGKLLGFLPQFDQNFVQNMFALQTDVAPYGLTIFYEPTENTSGVEMKISKEMMTYAEYLFQCIDNLGYVEYAYRTTPSSNGLEESDYTVLFKVDRSQ